MKMIDISPNLLNHFISLNFKCPYQASVMKMLDRIKSPIVRNHFIIIIFR